MSEANLETRLKESLDRSVLTLDELANKTKVPRATIRALMGEDVSVILPERVYLRGQVLLISRELGIDVEEARALFDQENPVQVTTTADLDQPRFGAGTTVLAASLGGIAILAIVLAFTS